MLTQCALCQHIVEVSSLKDHYLSECLLKDELDECPRCRAAILRPDFDKHVTAKKCPIYNPTSPLCQMCMKPVKNGDSDEGWKVHLMREGCTNSSRKPPRVKRSFSLFRRR